MRKGTLIRALACVLTILTALIVFTPVRETEAATVVYLDEIEDYVITVDVNDDGSLNMTYTLTWRVLDDKKEGPLTWVKIGIPNSDVDNIKARTENIKSAEYYREGDEFFIRVDFTNAHYAGKSFTFSFSFRQYNMFAKNGQTMVYDFTPGWFNKIRVDSYTIRWNTDKVQSITPNTRPNGRYYVWTGSLIPGGRTNAKITYPANAYNFKRHRVNHGVDWEKAGVILQVISCVFIMWFLIYSLIKSGDPYHSSSSSYDGGSFGGGHFGGGGGGGCACACACACAGGGRAGCSAKDFYGTKVSSARVRARLRAKRSEEENNRE